MHADDDTLRFTWLLDGVETTTEFQLTAEGADSTVLTLTQSHFDFAEAMSGSSIRGVLQTYWALAIANLAAHLEGRPPLPRTDFTSADLRGELVIAAPADKVWQSLTDSEQASAWFGFPIGIEPWVGGRYAMGGFDAGTRPRWSTWSRAARCPSTGGPPASRPGSWPSPVAGPR